MLENKYEAIYMSKLFVKFINNWLFILFKTKMEKIVYYSFFYWKHKLGITPIFYFFEAILKIRPVLSFYLFLIKKKKKKRIRIKPFYLRFWTRWQKAVYWLMRSIKKRHESKLFLKVINELFFINFQGKSLALNKKRKYYKIILSQKGSKNYKW